MRKLLNKPWFVGLLAVAAVIFVASSLPSRHTHVAVAPVASDVVQPESSVSDGAVPAATTAPLSIRDALKALAGAHSPRRDPFLPRAVAAAATAEKAAPDLTESVSVSAIWIQGGRTYLLVNNQVYQVGDRIGRLTLESASRDGVWVTHWKGRDFVAVGSAFTLITPARQAAAALSLSSES